VVAVLGVLAGLLQARPAQADTAAPVDRSYVVSAWNAGRAQVKAAAAAALVGSDDQVRSFLATGWQQAEQLDERDSLVDVMSSGGPALRAAAQTALDKADAGDTTAIGAFLDTGWQDASDTDRRISVDQLMAAGGPQVKAAAQKVLDSDDPQVMQAFLDSGWQSAWELDQTLQVDQAMAVGGPEVKAAAQRALDADTPEALQEFLSYGLDVASARDDEVATLSGLLAQAQAEADAATQDTKYALDEAGRAAAAAKAAHQAATEAAAATAAAKSDSAEAARQAQRAATAARKAAQAAEVAIQAANAADEAAHAAARAASRAAAAAAKASQKAGDAYRAAQDAAADKNKAANASAAATDADNAADQARDFATIADNAGKAMEAGKAALDNAKLARDEAIKAADDNDAAGQAAQAAGGDARDAVAASKVARANAARADRAVQSAEIYFNQAIDAAYAARDAARRAASDARAAAAAAREAAADAGNAALAASRATKYAQGAVDAANAAVAAADQATLVYTDAREAEADRISVAEDQALADAQDALQAYNQQAQQADWNTAQAAQRDAETNRLIAEAQNPSTDPGVAVTDARKVAFTLMTSSQGDNTRQAAQEALRGTDEQAVEFVRTGLPAATALDDRLTATNIAVTADSSRLRAAAEAVLQGSDADVTQFVQTQDYPNRATDDMIKVDQVMAAAKKSGDVVLANAAQAALDADTDQAFRDFLDHGQYTAEETGQQVRVDNLMAAADSGPEMKAAAQVALDGPPTAMAEFLDSGQYTAAERDADTAAHLAVVDGILDKTNEAAQTALQRAQEAQAAAFTANGDATKAAQYSTQAAQSAQNAANYANNAKASADAATTSVQKAAVAVQSARAAATRANTSADRAIASAAWAIDSHKQAVAAARKAHDQAVAARQSAIDAGNDAKTAAAAAQHAYDAYVTARNANISQCGSDYAKREVNDLKSLIEPDANDQWYQNCVHNFIDDPDQLATRAYINSSLCDLNKRNAAKFQSCIHSTLDPDFRGSVQLDYMYQALIAGGSFFLPAAAVAAVGCLPTVCGAVASILLPVADARDKVLKYINGDQSLATTALNLGKTGLEALEFWAIGKLLGKAYFGIKKLRIAWREAEAAEAELKAINDSRLFTRPFGSCLATNSFAPQTPVLMADGSNKPIADVKVGDHVLATDPIAGITRAEPVTKLHRNEDTALADVTVGSGLLLHTTQKHPFWDATKRQWTNAADLRPGHLLRSSTAVVAPRIVAVRKYGGDRIMDNLTVAGLHTYYVLVGNTPILVHNTDCWTASAADLEAIDAEYGEAVANGVEYNVQRYNEGATGHALNGIGTDLEGLARYLAQPRTYNYEDKTTLAAIYWDAKNEILVVRTEDRYLGQMIHAYNYSSAEWLNAVTSGKYVPVS
jgi:hypothetical protein